MTAAVVVAVVPVGAGGVLTVAAFALESVELEPAELASFAVQA